VSFGASKNKPGALELARFLMRTENALALASAARVLPATVRADTIQVARDHPGWQMMLRQLDSAMAPPNHAAWTEMEAAIEDELGPALHGTKTATQAVQDASTKLEGLAAKK